MKQSSAETVGLYIAFDWINLGKKLIDMMSVDQVEWEMYKYNICLCELVLGISHYLITSSLFRLFIIFSSLWFSFWHFVFTGQFEQEDDTWLFAACRLPTKSFIHVILMHVP